MRPNIKGSLKKTTGVSCGKIYIIKRLTVPVAKHFVFNYLFYQLKIYKFNPHHNRFFVLLTDKQKQHRSIE